MRTDQIAELEIMLDGYGLEHVLDQIADCLQRKAERWRDKRLVTQAQALRAQASALAAGRALTYATQAPLRA